MKSAGELVKAGAIGQVIQTIGLGPHRMNLSTLPEWFFDKAKFGGILCDIASHQFDQYLFFTGSTQAEVVSSQVGNVHYPQYPKFEDFGDVMLRGNGNSARTNACISNPIVEASSETLPSRRSCRMSLCCARVGPAIPC